MSGGGRGGGRDREGSVVQGPVGLRNGLSAACAPVNSRCALPAPKLLTRRGYTFHHTRGDSAVDRVACRPIGCNRRRGFA